MSATKKLIIFTIFIGAILVYSLFLPDETDTPKGKHSSEIEMKVNMGQICFPEYSPSEGKLLFNQIQQKYKDCDLSPMLISDHKVKYCLIIPIPTDEYHRLSIEERKRIMNYVSSLIPDAKKNYGRYLILSPSAPVFQTNVFEKYTEIMNYRCCAISVGAIDKDYYYKTGSGERVYGDFVAEKHRIYPDDLEANRAISDASSIVVKNRETPLMKAIRSNAGLSEVETLLEAGADIEAKDENGATPLMLAANFNKNPEVLKVLLEAGADIETRLGNSGMTVLMMAAVCNDNPEILKLLLAYGADSRAKDNKGRTVSYYKKAGIDTRKQLRKITTPSHSVGIVQNSPWDDSVSQVKSYIKRNLKDPKSFDAIGWGKVTKTSDGNFQVMCKYRAKNSFGGYVISHQLFTLNYRGTVINVQEL